MAYGSRFNVPTENNSFEGKGIRSLSAPIAYATPNEIPIPTRKAFRHYLDFATLTGALTLNCTDVTQYTDGDELFLSFISDATGRTVTWGTNIRAAANLAMTASQVGSAHLVFINSKWTVIAQAATAA